MRKRVAALFAMLVAATAFAAPVGAITYNAEKDFVHDFVGLFVFYTTPDPVTGDPFSHRCSGSLISPTIFVTAGHCDPSMGKGGSCNGDSGGPVFEEGTNVIAGVVSFGRNPQCKGQDFSYRLDRQEVIDWILDPNREDAG